MYIHSDLVVKVLYCALFSYNAAQGNTQISSFVSLSDLSDLKVRLQTNLKLCIVSLSLQPHIRKLKKHKCKFTEIRIVPLTLIKCNIYIYIFSFPQNTQ